MEQNFFFAYLLLQPVGYFSKVLYHFFQKNSITKFSKNKKRSRIQKILLQNTLSFKKITSYLQDPHQL